METRALFSREDLTAKTPRHKDERFWWFMYGMGVLTGLQVGWLLLL